LSVLPLNPISANKSVSSTISLINLGAMTEDGKERLEALLLQYERNDLAKGDHPFAADISYLREELGLA